MVYVVVVVFPIHHRQRTISKFPIIGVSADSFFVADFVLVAVLVAVWVGVLVEILVAVFGVILIAIVVLGNEIRIRLCLYICDFEPAVADAAKVVASAVVDATAATIAGTSADRIAIRRRSA